MPPASPCLTRAGPAQFSLTSQPTKADRERMYQEVADEVAALERQGNILKKVILLARPTVVHIEAKKTQDGFGRRSVEEAGSRCDRPVQRQDTTC